ncbi:Inversin-A [Nymphon striatum]|nr:Inversin-A [Nymphon striatum]
MELNCNTESADNSLCCVYAYTGLDKQLNECICRHKSILYHVDHLQRTLFHLAVMGNQMKTLKMLLSFDADQVNMQDKFGRTPLHWAAQKGRFEIVKLLLQHGAKIDIQDNYGTLALQLSTNNHKTLLCILQHIDIKSQSVMLSNANSSHQTFSSTPLIASNCIQNYILDFADSHERTALHWSAFYANAKNVKMLVEHGATVDILDVDKKSPLHWAASSNKPQSVQCVKIILAKSSDMINGQDYHGRSILHWAISDGTLELVDYLCSLPALEIDQVDNAFLTPLHWAAQLGFTLKLKILIDNGADRGAKDKTNFTPIMYASANNHHFSFRMYHAFAMFCKVKEAKQSDGHGLQFAINQCDKCNKVKKKKKRNSVNIVEVKPEKNEVTVK